MSEAQAEQVVEQTEEEILAEVMEGYNPARGDEPPAEDDPAATEGDSFIAETPELTVDTLAAELKDLKARVAASHSDPDVVRKMHGEIGNINRTLLAMQPQAPAPTPDDGDAAMDASAAEYEDVTGPLVKEIKAMKARMAQQSANQTPEDFDARVSATVTRIREKDAIETLEEDHPDFRTVRDTLEYKSWLSRKTSEFQERFTKTWNPAVVARGLTEFKDSLKQRATKQTRLAGAITPQGVPQQVGSSTISDDEALWAGYNKGRKRL